MRGIGIRLYFLISFFLVISVVAAVSVALWLASDQLQSTAVLMHDGVESIMTAQSLLSNVEIHRRQSLLMNVHETEARTRKRREAERELIATLDDIKQFVSPGEETRLADRVQHTVQDYLSLSEQLRRQGLSGTSLFRRTSDAFNAAADAIEDLIQINIDQAVDMEKQAALKGLSYKRWAIALFGAVLGGVSLLLFMLQQLVYAPITHLQRAIENYSRNKKIPDLIQSPLTELQDIGSAFHNLTLDISSQNEKRLVFISALAHDLRNPLGAIQMSLDLLIQEGASEKDKRDLFEILQRQVRQMRGLVEELMDSTRIEAGQLQLERSDEDVCGLLRDAVQLFQSSSRVHHLDIEIPENKILVNCDPRRISQVFNNLMSNAIKYSPDGGRVTVRTRVAAEQVQISIHDDGVGIAPSDMAKIFEPFQRGESSRHQIAGVGLGLSTSKKIVEAHGGIIEVRSQLGLGATFTVTLPIVQPASVSASV